MLDDKISIIVPLLNEVAQLSDLLKHLELLEPDQVIFVDGGSDDGSWQFLQKRLEKESKSPYFQAIQSDAGRARQMNAGAGLVQSGTLLFLHCDTRLPQDCLSEINQAGLQKRVWGRFDVTFKEKSKAMQVIAYFINLRSRLTGIATGDQAIFINTKAFELVGGYANIELMEDVAISKQLKKYCHPYCSRSTIITSARRWLDHGIIKTVLLMWGFRLAYFFGGSPKNLAARYHK